MSPSTEVTHGFSKLGFIGRLDLLQGMSQEAVHRFNAMVRRTKRRRGEWIFLNGDRADSIYLLQEGRLKITALSEDGHEVVHGLLGQARFSAIQVQSSAYPAPLQPRLSRLLLYVRFTERTSKLS